MKKEKVWLSILVMKALRIKILSYLFIMLSCTTTPILEKQEIQTEFLEYVEEFEKYYGQTVKGFRVRFANLDYMPQVTGLCMRSTHKMGINTIMIDRHYWDQMTDSEREMLMWHELAHCILYRNHDERIARNGCPVSLMYPTGFPEFCYNQYRDWYLKELFDTKRN